MLYLKDYLCLFICLFIIFYVYIGYSYKKKSDVSKYFISEQFLLEMVQSEIS